MDLVNPEIHKCRLANQMDLPLYTYDSSVLVVITQPTNYISNRLVLVINKNAFIGFISLSSHSFSLLSISINHTKRTMYTSMFPKMMMMSL